LIFNRYHRVLAFSRSRNHDWLILSIFNRVGNQISYNLVEPQPILVALNARLQRE
jgi:hypothetical protein